MKTVLKYVVGTEQQGFIFDGDILGSLLVKEMIEYCADEEIEAMLILMDFENAYDRVDRQTMIETMRSMNFGEQFITKVELLYTDSMARAIVNGEMGEGFKTEGETGALLVPSSSSSCRNCWPLKRERARE